jgi:proline racemase
MSAGLDLSELRNRLDARFQRRVLAVDSHTAGESTRVILGGLRAPDTLASVAQMRAWMQREADDLRRFITHPPRGHRDLVGAWITPPRAAGADFGVVFMDARRYPMACGTATVGAITTMVELGLVEPRGGAGEIAVDTPAGLVRARVRQEGGRAASVELQMMASCVVAEALPLALESGEVEAEVIYVGGCLALVSSESMPCPLEPERAAEIVGFGEAVIAAANRARAIAHPITGEPTTIDGCVIFDPADDASRRGRGAVVYGAAHLDRSPCGTGTAAKMTRLYRRGELALGERYENRGILDTVFEGYLAEEAPVGDHAGVRAHIRTSAQLVSVGELLADPSDPFPSGFLLPA